MSNFITATEVITLSFNRIIENTKILDNDIASSEWRYIRPILTNNLFEDIKANPGNYTDLINDFIKPALAYYVKFHLLPELMFTLSDRGSFVQTAGDTNVMTDEQRRVYIDSVLEKANSLAVKLKDYIIENGLIRYAPESEILGGLLITHNI